MSAGNQLIHLKLTTIDPHTLADLEFSRGGNGFQKVPPILNPVVHTHRYANIKFLLFCYLLSIIRETLPYKIREFMYHAKRFKNNKTSGYFEALENWFCKLIVQGKKSHFVFLGMFWVFP